MARLCSNLTFTCYLCLIHGVRESLTSGNFDIILHAVLDLIPCTLCRKAGLKHHIPNHVCYHFHPRMTPDGTTCLLIFICLEWPNMIPIPPGHGSWPGRCVTAKKWGITSSQVPCLGYSWFTILWLGATEVWSADKYNKYQSPLGRAGLSNQ